MKQYATKLFVNWIFFKHTSYSGRSSARYKVSLFRVRSKIFKNLLENKAINIFYLFLEEDLFVNVVLRQDRISWKSSHPDLYLLQ